MKKHIIISIVVLITATIAVGVFLCVTRDEGHMLTTTQEEKNAIKNDNNEADLGKEDFMQVSKLSEKIDTSNWQVYQNKEKRFGFRYPQDLNMVFQNEYDSAGSAIILFYNNKYYNFSTESNPLLSIIGTGAGYLDMEIIGYDYILDTDFNLMEYVTSDLFYYIEGKDMRQKLNKWSSIRSDGDIVINFYTTETVDEKIITEGAVWMVGDRLFNIKMAGKDSEYLKKVYKNIANSFYIENQ